MMKSSLRFAVVLGVFVAFGYSAVSQQLHIDKLVLAGTIF